MNTQNTEAFTTKNLTFTTGVGNLTLGSINTNPSSGYADTTVFTISLSNFASDYLPVIYDIYGLQYAG